MPCNADWIHISGKNQTAIHMRFIFVHVFMNVFCIIFVSINHCGVSCLWSEDHVGSYFVCNVWPSSGSHPRKHVAKTILVMIFTIFPFLYFDPLLCGMQVLPFLKYVSLSIENRISTSYSSFIIFRGICTLNEWRTRFSSKVSAAHINATTSPFSINTCGRSRWVNFCVRPSSQVTTRSEILKCLALSQ